MTVSSIFLKPKDNQPSPARTSVDEFLMAKTGKAPGKGSGRLIFVVDATASRKPLWDMARGLTGDMVRESASVGRLEMQLVFFSGGLDAPLRCSASGWVSDPTEFSRIMAKAECQGGYTQITRALEHAKIETTREKVGAIVLIGDACESVEDNLDRVGAAAKNLGQLKTPVFAFLEGREPTAEVGFRSIAELSGGAFGRFDAGGVKQLGELLRAVALYTTGGLTALAKQTDTASVLLLEQMTGGRTKS